MLPKHLHRLKHWPWASLGRRETTHEIFRKSEEQRSRVSLLKKRPSFSFLVYSKEAWKREALEQTWESILLQSYPDWEAIFVGPDDLSAVSGLSMADRARAIRLENSSEIQLKNAATQAARGDWICFLPVGDVLSPSALFTLVLELQEKNEPSLFFSHEVWLMPNQRPCYFSKPRVSEFNLLHFNPIGTSWWIKRESFESLGGFSDDTDAAHEHDLFLRLFERAADFQLLPWYLRYRSIQSLPTFAPSPRLKEWVSRHLSRQNISATVQIEGEGAHSQLRVIPAPPANSLISAVICFRDRSDWTIRSLQHLADHAGQVPLEVWLVNNNSQPDERERVRQAASRLAIETRLVDYEGAFNFAHMHNWVCRTHCRGDLLFLLNNDVFLEKGNLDELAAWAKMDWSGTVGMRLNYPDGRVQHGGFRAFYGGAARLARMGHIQGNDFFCEMNHEVFGNTFAACMFRREVFLAVGGLREWDVPNGFGDVVFNFECLRRGLRNLYLGGVQGTHLESASRGLSYEYWEEFYVEREYPDILQRMLREDLGLDRVPAADDSISEFLREALLSRVRKKAPWLKPLKGRLKGVISKLLGSTTTSLRA